MFLAVSPKFLDLSVSAVLEIPATAFTMWALSFLHLRLPRFWKMALSSMAYAFALQIKLTAILWAPAIVAGICTELREAPRTSWRQVCFVCFAWCVCVGLVAAIVASATGENYATAIRSHFLPNPEYRSEIARYALSPKVFTKHLEGLMGLGMTIVWVLRERQWRAITYPLLLLLPAVAAHSLYRPYWDYYYPHFGLPISWLCGVSLAGMFRSIVSETGQSRLFRRVCILGVVSVCTIGLVDGGGRLMSSVSGIRMSPRTRESVLVAKMASLKESTRWVYTTATMVPFYAKANVIPELSVVPLKRYWCQPGFGEWAHRMVETYAPEQMLLNDMEVERFRGLVERDYAVVYEGEAYRLYVRTNLMR